MAAEEVEWTGMTSLEDPEQKMMMNRLTTVGQDIGK